MPRLRSAASGALIALPAGVLAGGLAILAAQAGPLAFLVVVGAIGVVALALWRPLWAIYLAVLLIPLEAVSAHFGSFGLSPAEFVAVIAAGAWLLRRTVEGGASLRSPLTWPLLALLVIHIPGLFLAVDPFAVVKETIMWSAFFVLFLAILSDEGRNTPEVLAGTIAIAGAVVAAVAVVTSAGANQEALAGAGLVTDRATGSLGAPTLLGIFVVMVLPLQLVFMLRGRSSVVRLGGLLATGLSLTALSLALTRSAFVALAIVGAWLLVSWRPARRAALIAAVVISALLLTRFNPVSSVVNTSVLTERLASIGSPGTQTARLRFAIWDATPRMIEDNLAFGLGADNYATAAPLYGLDFPAGVPSHAHNIVLTMAAEFGVPGLLVLIWLAAAITRTLFNAIRLLPEPRRSLAIGLAGAFLANAVDGIFDYAFSDNVFFLTVVLLAAIAVRLERSALVTAPAAEAQSAVPVPVPA